MTEIEQSLQEAIAERKLIKQKQKEIQEAAKAAYLGIKTLNEQVRLRKKEQELKKVRWPEQHAAYIDSKFEQFCEILNFATHFHQMEKPKIGRPEWPLAEILFCIVLKEWVGVSSRLLIPYLIKSQKQGYLQLIPHYNSVAKWSSCKDDDFIENIHELLGRTASPFYEVDKTGSVCLYMFGNAYCDAQAQVSSGTKIGWISLADFHDKSTCEEWFDPEDRLPSEFAESAILNFKELYQQKFFSRHIEGMRIELLCRFVARNIDLIMEHNLNWEKMEW